MATLKDYQRYFKPDEVPAAMVKLIEFAETQRGWFSQGFELECSGDDSEFLSYSEKPEFLNALFAIAQADGTGSTYALWRQDGSLEHSPIVAFGSEGGVHVVARDLLGLFRLLTLDAEPMISWEKVFYCKLDDVDPSEGAADYAKWLAKSFKLKPVKDAKEATEIVKDAQKAHEKKFLAWFKQFYG